MNKIKVAFVGTRGIPNNYGGFEQFAEYISKELVQSDFEVTVYNPSFHSYNASEYEGVKIVKKWSPEALIGNSANFIYDFLSYRNAIKSNHDIVYLAGYSTVFPANILIRKNNSKIVTNMDGLEFKRSKYSKLAQIFILFTEKIAVWRSDFLVSDNIGIQKYYEKTYKKSSFFIPYGAEIPLTFDESILKTYNVVKNEYFLLIARFEPENNLEMIFNGYLKSSSKLKFLAVGNCNNKYGKSIQKKYPQIQYIDSLYNKEHLNSLRHFSSIYFHGHSVGGTNPSLLEAMACQSFIFSHNNEFNKSVLHDNANYFKNSEEISNGISNIEEIKIKKNNFVESNLKKIKSIYTWENICNLHKEMFKSILQQ
jgi:glycosyltransferase involved in cell wall biosynthesis